MKPENSDSSIAQLDEGIFVIPGRKSGGCNMFVLRGTRKNILIDVGLPDGFDYLCSGLAQIGLTIADIQMVILSHEHIDHVGGLQHLPNHIVVAAHQRVASKFLLNDQFSTMSGAFNARGMSFHVDIHLEEGTLIDIGGIKLKTLYTPGHSSGSICLYEPNRAALFTADTIFAGGVLGGIFASGNISDYINSLERLRELRLKSMYPGHGRMSSTPDSDIDRAIKGSRALMSDTQTLFDAIDIGSAFNSIRSAAVDYSRRAAERRQSTRVPGKLAALAHLSPEESRVETVNVSEHGMLIDQAIPSAKGELVRFTFDGLGELETEVVSHEKGRTRFKFLPTACTNQALLDWLGSNGKLNKR